MKRAFPRHYGFVLILFIASVGLAQSLLELDSLEQLRRDSLSDVASHQIRKEREHLGPNGFGMHLLLISPLKPERSALTVGATLSGDVLTGIPYIHLIPAVRYWQRDSVMTLFDSLTQTTHPLTRTVQDVGFLFQTVFITDRFTKENLRLFLGGGPSIHLELTSLVEELPAATYGTLSTEMRNGMHALLGLEWPFSDLASLTLSATYGRLYNWDKLASTSVAFLIGLNI